MRFLFSVVLASAGVPGFCQTLEWAFAPQGQVSGGSPTGLCTDDLGRTYHWGWSGTDTLDLDPGVGQAFVYPNTSFLARFSTSGALELVIPWHATVASVIYDVKVAPDHSMVFGGDLRGTIDIDPGPDSLILSGTEQMLMARYDSSGTLVWGFATGPSNQSIFLQVEMDATGDIIAAGTYWESTPDIDPGPGVVPLSGMTNWWNHFIARYDGNGNFINVRPFRIGDHLILAPVLQMDASDHLWMAISYQDTLDIDPGPDTSAVISAGGYDAAIARFDPSGELLWHGTVEGAGGQFLKDLAIDGLGRAIAVGFTNMGDVDLDPTASADVHTPYASDSVQGWWCIMDAGGNYEAGGLVGLGGLALLESVCAGADGRFYMTGECTSIDLDGTVHTSAGGFDAMILARAPDGSPLYSFGLGSTMNEGLGSSAWSADGALHVAGSFQGVLDVDPSAAVVPLASPMPGGGIMLMRYTSIPLFVQEVVRGALDAMAWPNPVADHVLVDLGTINGPIPWALFDDQGRLLSEGVTTTMPFMITTDVLAPGHYLVRLRGGSAIIAVPLLKE